MDIFRIPEYRIGEPEEKWAHKVKKKVLPAIKVYDCINNQERLVQRPVYYTKETSNYEKNYKKIYRDNNSVFYRKNGPFSNFIDNTRNEKNIFLDYDNVLH